MGLCEYSIYYRSAKFQQGTMPSPTIWMYIVRGFPTKWLHVLCFLCHPIQITIYVQFFYNHTISIDLHAYNYI
jgi:hypothetical protein